MTIRKSIGTNLQEVSDAVREIEDLLKSFNVKSDEQHLSLLVLEELLVRMTQVADKGSNVTIIINRNYRSINIKLSCKGADANLAATLSGETPAVLGQEYDAETEEVIREMILKSQTDRISCRYDKGINSVSICVYKNQRAVLYDTLFALIGGVVVGCAIKYLCPLAFASGISTNLFAPIYTIFLNSIKMLMAPLVFFSLASCIVNFSDLRSLGRTGAKVMGLYMLTTCIAMSLGYAANAIFQPGQPGLIDMSRLTMDGINAGAIESVSIKDTIVGIFPTNFIGSFVKSDMLQIIFLAFLIGISAGSLGKYSSSVRHFIMTFEALFAKITSFVITLMPIAIFVSMANMVININMEAAVALFGWIWTETLALAAMIVVYLIMLRLLGGMNPFIFLRKFFPVYLTGLSTSSSNATMPSNMKCCGEQLGVSPRVYSFSIPLGATVNMDGTSITYIMLALFLAGLTGTPIEGAAMLTLLTTVFILSIASPGIPGVGIACMAMLLPQIGVPVESLSLVLGVFPIINHLQTGNNVMGDAVVTTIVAKSEGALDTERLAAE